MAELDAPAPPRRRTATAVLIATLVVLTAGGVGFGVLQFQRAQRADERADALATEAAMNDAELAKAAAETEAVTQSAEQQAADVAAVTAELAERTAERDRLAGLFPLDATSFATAALEGAYTLTVTPVGDACTGFSNSDATCVVANFPTDLVVIGNATDGLTVSSSWFAPVPLNTVGASWAGKGALYDTVANTCGGAALATSVEVSIAVDNVGPNADQTALHVGQLSGRLTFASAETEQCVAATRAATFVTTK